MKNKDLLILGGLAAAYFLWKKKNQPPAPTTTSNRPDVSSSNVDITKTPSVTPTPTVPVVQTDLNVIDALPEMEF